MPWTCPACQNSVRLSHLETAPRPGVTYRCPICRLELILDPQRGRMVVAPLRGEPDEDEKGDLKKEATSAGSAHRR